MNNIIRGEGYNNRNAISVISGKNVSISGNTIEHVSSKNMPGAIDIEANNAAYTIDDITISWNNITDSNGGLGAICIVSQNNAPAHNIQIDHNTIKDSRFGLCLVINSDDCVSNVSIVSNVIDDNTTPYKYIGSSRTQNWVIKDNVTKFKNQKFGGNIKFSNLFFSVPE